MAASHCALPCRVRRQVILACATHAIQASIRSACAGALLGGWAGEVALHRAAVHGLLLSLAQLGPPVTDVLLQSPSWHALLGAQCRCSHSEACDVLILQQAACHAAQSRHFAMDSTSCHCAYVGRVGTDASPCRPSTILPAAYHSTHDQQCATQAGRLTVPVSVHEVLRIVTSLCCMMVHVCCPTTRRCVWRAPAGGGGPGCAAAPGPGALACAGGSQPAGRRGGAAVCGPHAGRRHARAVGLGR